MHAYAFRGGMEDAELLRRGRVGNIKYGQAAKYSSAGIPLMRGSAYLDSSYEQVAPKKWGFDMLDYHVFGILPGRQCCNNKWVRRIAGVNDVHSGTAAVVRVCTYVGVV